MPVVFYNSHMTTNTLPIKQLQPNPFQPRSSIKKEDIEELAQSIKAYGILEPLVVAQTPAGYQIIAGERRWRAAQMAGLTEVPVHVKKTTPKGMLEMAIVENVQRVDLSALERAQAFLQLKRTFNYINSQIAEKVGKSPAYVSNSLKLLELPDAIADGLLAGLISEGHARALLGIDNEAEMVQAYKIILKENASVRRAEKLAQLFKERMGKDKGGPGRPAVAINQQDLKQLQTAFQQLFNTKAQLKVARSNRQTKLTITLKGSPEETQEDLEKIVKLAQH
jgi:ParB family transcriptional regulator, chromosome partitioning protein